MAYPQENHDKEIKIKELQQKLRDLDSDYNTLQECKQQLAAGSILLNDLFTQCSDIKTIFDRGTIEGRYDSCQITFKNKNMVFEYLDNIVSSTNNFGSSCSEIKTKVDTYGTSLDDECKKIADEAKTYANRIDHLQSDWTFMKKY